MAALNTDAQSKYVAVEGRETSVRDLISRLRSDRGLLRRVLMLGGVVVVALVSVAEIGRAHV